MEPGNPRVKEQPTSRHEARSAPVESSVAAEIKAVERRAARFYSAALILAFGPLALGLVTNVLNEYGLVSVAGTLDLFRMAPVYSLFTMPAAIVVLILAVRARFPRREPQVRREKLP